MSFRAQYTDVRCDITFTLSTLTLVVNKEGTECIASWRDNLTWLGSKELVLQAIDKEIRRLAAGLLNTKPEDLLITGYGDWSRRVSKQN